MSASFLNFAERLRARINHMSSSADAAADRTSPVPFLAGALLGGGLAIWLQTGYRLAVEGGDEGFETAVLMVVTTPFIILISMLFSVLAGLNRVKSFIRAFSILMQLGIMVFGARVLTDWYTYPDNSRYEPLFTIIGIAIGGIQLGQYWIRTLEAALQDRLDAP